DFVAFVAREISVDVGGAVVVLRAGARRAEGDHDRWRVLAPNRPTNGGGVVGAIGYRAVGFEIPRERQAAEPVDVRGWAVVRRFVPREFVAMEAGVVPIEQDIGAVVRPYYPFEFVEERFHVA